MLSTISCVSNANSEIKSCSSFEFIVKIVDLFPASAQYFSASSNVQSSADSRNLMHFSSLKACQLPHGDSAATLKKEN
jgi:hypothetical protein